MHESLCSLENENMQNWFVPYRLQRCLLFDAIEQQVPLVVVELVEVLEQVLALALVAAAAAAAAAAVAV